MYLTMIRETIKSLVATGAVTLISIIVASVVVSIIIYGVSLV